MRKITLIGIIYEGNVKSQDKSNEKTGEINSRFHLLYVGDEGALCYSSSSMVKRMTISPMPSMAAGSRNACWKPYSFVLPTMTVGGVMSSSKLF